jgi:AcrR family transcriptional regulator
MKNAIQTENKINPADIILQAAVNRFSEYGYNKTTMTEIADDAGMSAANIYRYYKNKEEIAAECAKNWMCERTQVLKSVIRDTNLTAIEKLEKYALTTLQVSQNKANENRKVEEICSEITKNRPDLVHDKIKNEQSLIMEIISFGNQTGEFDVDNVVETAATIHAMLVIFDVPMFMHLYTHEEYKKKANAVIKLLVSGLGKKI